MSARDEGAFREILEVACASGGAARLDALDALHEAVSRGGPCDQPTWDRAVAILAARGIPVARARVPATLRVGEAWLLVTDGAEGVATRLEVRAKHARAGEAHPADSVAIERSSSHADALDAVARALRLDAGDRAALAERGVTVTTVERAQARVVGDSLGAALAVALASAHTGVAPRSSVALSARVSPDGALHPVEGLDRKLAALAARWPEVTTVVVSAGQRVDRIPASIRVQRRSTVVDALRAAGIPCPAGSSAGPRVLARLGGVAAIIAIVGLSRDARRSSSPSPTMASRPAIAPLPVRPVPRDGVPMRTPLAAGAPSSDAPARAEPRAPRAMTRLRRAPSLDREVQPDSHHASLSTANDAPLLAP